MSQTPDPTPFSLSELPRNEQERILARKDLLLEAHVQLFSLDPGGCDVRFEVPVSSTLRTTAESRPETVENVADVIRSSASEAIEILVLSTGDLQKSGPIRDTEPPPALEMHLYLHGFRHQDAEVELAMPDPKLFRASVEAGSTLEAVMGTAVGIIDREVREALRTRAASRELFESPET